MELCYGYISDVDPDKGLVRVAFNEDDDGEGNKFVSGWIPFITPSSTDDIVTFPFSINAHVVCMMDCYKDTGVVMGQIFSDDNLPDGAGPDIFRIKFKDGSSVEFNRSSGNYTADFKGDVVINGGTNVTLKGTNVKIDGKLTVTGDVVAQGKVDVTGKINAQDEIKSLIEVKAGPTNVRLTLHTHNVTAIGSPTGPSIP